MTSKRTLLLLGYILIIIPTIFANINPVKLEILQDFARKQVLYSDSVPIDSTISWSQEILLQLPILRNESNEDTEKSSLLKYQLVQAYIIEGYTGLAFNAAKRMYDEAEKYESTIAKNFAQVAISDYYRLALNMTEQAEAEYKEVLKNLETNNRQNKYIPHLLIKLSYTYREQNQMEKYYNTLEKVLSYIETTHENDLPLRFFYCNEKLYYHSVLGRKDEKHALLALNYLDQMDSITNYTHEKHYRFYADMARAAYYHMLGYKDPSYLARSYEIYNTLQQQFSHNKQSAYYRMIAKNKIHLCVLSNRPEEACLIYQDLYPPIDTLASKSYLRQIRTMKTRYEAESLAHSVLQVKNKVYKLFLIGGALVLTLMIWLTILLRRKQLQLVESTHQLTIKRKNAEKAMHLKSLFLSNMSHEIRTPLNALSGFSDLLCEPSLDEDTRRMCNKVIEQNSDLLLKLINDVVDLSNFDFGKIQLHIAPNDAVSICRTVTETVDKVKQTQAEVLFETDLEKLPLETDASRLQQILINLLINATKFTSEGTITLQLKLNPDNQQEAFFSVTDTGCGIALDKQSQIFQRFEKLNETDQGTGLGLSICQLIIENVGGKIWIDSTYTEGARFCFTHPLSQKNKEKKK